MTNQPDEEGRVRKVWIFPLELLDVEDVENPSPESVVRLPVKELVVRSQSVMKKEHKPTMTEVQVYYRDPYLKEAVKRIADGACQMCNQEAPFLDLYGNPYLEVHHVKRLADGGSDTIDNVVAICPNCHRKVHILEDEKDVLLLERVAADNKRQISRLMKYSQQL